MGIFVLIGFIAIIWYCIEMHKINDVKRCWKRAKDRNDSFFQMGFFNDNQGNMRDAKTFELCHRKYTSEDYIVVYSKSGRERNITSEQAYAKFLEAKAKYKEGDEVTVCVYKEAQRHEKEYFTGMVGVRYADLKTEKGSLMTIRNIDNNKYYMATLCGYLVRPTDGQRWMDKRLLSEEQLKEKEKKYIETIKLFNETQKKRKGKVPANDFFYNRLESFDFEMKEHINDYFEEKREREKENGR